MEPSVDFFHYDFYSQALAKIERGHDLDLTDINHLVNTGLIEPDRLWKLFLRIEGDLYKYPAVDQNSFRGAVEEFVKKFKS